MVNCELFCVLFSRLHRCENGAHKRECRARCVRHGWTWRTLCVWLHRMEHLNKMKEKTALIFFNRHYWCWRRNVIRLCRAHGRMALCATILIHLRANDFEREKTSRSESNTLNNGGMIPRLVLSSV